MKKKNQNNRNKFHFRRPLDSILFIIALPITLIKIKKKNPNNRKIIYSKRPLDSILRKIALLITLCLCIQPCILRFNLYINGVTTNAEIYKFYHRNSYKGPDRDFYYYKFNIDNNIFIGSSCNFERGTTHIGDTVTIMYLPCNPNKNDLKYSVDNFSLHWIAKLFK